MTETKICFMVVGVSGSGKSTVIKKIANIVGMPSTVFSLDISRMNLMHAVNTGQWWSDLDSEADLYRMAFDYANEHKEEFDKQVNKDWALVLQSKAIFVDNTNLTRKSRARWVAEARQKGFTIWTIMVHAPIDVCISRQHTRGDKAVPESVIRDMYMRLQEVMVPSESDFILHVDGTDSSLPAIGTFHLT